MGNEWQTVPGPKSKAKAKESKGKNTSDGNTGSTSDPASAVLAQIDADWRQSKQNGTRIANGGGFNSLEVEASPPPTPRAAEKASGAPAGKDKDAAKKPSKPKKPKVKKVATGEVAARINAVELGRVLEGIQQKYQTDEVHQLDTLADHFIGLFKDVDLPFNKTVLESPRTKSAAVPLQDVPPEVITTTATFLQAKDAAALAALATKLADAVIEDVPESSSSKVTPPKAKVGLLVVLSLILRTRPEVLLLIAPAFLRNGATYSTPRHLPFQLWMFDQAASSDLGVAAGAWARILLPQVVGKEVPEAIPPNQKPGAVAPPVHKLGSSGVETALGYMEDILATSKLVPKSSNKTQQQRIGPTDGDGRGYWALKVADTTLLRHAQRGISIQEGGKAAVEPVVPSGALELVTRTCFSLEPAFGPVAPRNRLLNIYEELRELHLAGVAAGVNKPQDAVRLLLETASISQEASTSAAHVDDTVGEAARNLVELLHADPPAVASHWEQRHKHQIRGSSAVLSSLKTHPERLNHLLNNPHRRTLFLATLQRIKERHRNVKAHGKSWQQSCAKSSEKSIQALSEATLRTRRNGLLSSTVLMAAFVTLLLVFLARQEAFQEWFEELRKIQAVNRVAQALEDAFSEAKKHIEPLYKDRVDGLVRGVKGWGGAEYDAHVKPLLEQLRPLARDLGNRASSFVHDLRGN